VLNYVLSSLTSSSNIPYLHPPNYITYLNSVSLSIRLSEVLKPKSLLIKLSPQTQGPKNYSGLRVLTFTFTSVSAQQLSEVLTSYFYFYVRFRTATAGGPYFLLLRLFPRSNCRRRWGRYFWDLEGG
jgi:hypothetical protein